MSRRSDGEARSPATIGRRREDLRRRRFVGRATEIGFVRAALAEDEPPFSVLYVHGPGGVGKTALLGALADAAASVGVPSVRLDSAYLHAFRAADDIDRAAAGGRTLDRVTRARTRQDTGWAARQCREAVDILVSAHGASTFAEVNPLQRVWRDLNTASRHTIVAPIVNQEIYGRALLDVEEHATELV